MFSRTQLPTQFLPHALSLSLCTNVNSVFALSTNYRSATWKQATNVPVSIVSSIHLICIQLNRHKSCANWWWWLLLLIIIIRLSCICKLRQMRICILNAFANIYKIYYKCKVRRLCVGCVTLWGATLILLRNSDAILRSHTWNMIWLMHLLVNMYFIKSNYITWHAYLSDYQNGI